jgi:DNA-directed RNA polymerase specialized sigma24 family protein
VRRRREEPHDSESNSSTGCLCSTADDRAAHDPERCAELSRACSLLDELLAALPDPLRRVLVLAEIEQLEVAEIAALERIPTGTAASRLRRARSQFSALLRRNAHRNPFGRSA